MDILRCNERATEHPFYQQAKEFIDTHPLSFQETMTKYSIYCTLLMGNFFKFSVEQYQKNLEDTYSRATEFVVPSAIPDCHGDANLLAGYDESANICTDCQRHGNAEKSVSNYIGW